MLIVYGLGFFAFYTALVIAWLDARQPPREQGIAERTQRVMVWLGLTAPVWPLVIVAGLVALIVVPVRWGWRLMGWRLIRRRP